MKRGLVVTLVLAVLQTVVSPPGTALAQGDPACGVDSVLAVGDYVVVYSDDITHRIADAAGPDTPASVNFLAVRRYGGLTQITDGPRCDAAGRTWWLVDELPAVAWSWVPETLDGAVVLKGLDSFGPQFQTTNHLQPVPPVDEAYQRRVLHPGDSYMPDLVPLGAQVEVVGTGYAPGESVQVRIVQPDGVVFLTDTRVVTNAWGCLMIRWTPLPWQHPTGLWMAELTGADGTAQVFHIGVIPGMKPHVRTMCRDGAFTLVLDGSEPGAVLKVRLMRPDLTSYRAHDGFTGETVYVWQVRADARGQLLVTFDNITPEPGQYIMVEQDIVRYGGSRLYAMPFGACDAGVGRSIIVTTYQDVTRDAPFVYEFWAEPGFKYGMTFQTHRTTPGPVRLDVLGPGGEILATSTTGGIGNWSPEEAGLYTALGHVDLDVARGKLTINKCGVG